MELLNLFNNELVFEPSSKKRSVKDMIIDKSDFWEKHNAIKPYVETEVDPHPEHETKQSIEQSDMFLDSDLCIQCGACHYSCPVVAGEWRDLPLDHQAFGSWHYQDFTHLEPGEDWRAGKREADLGKPNWLQNGGKGVWGTGFQMVSSVPRPVSKGD